jgi:hypothetical protein
VETVFPSVVGEEPAGASLLVALDVQPGVAMQILRHSQIAVTMDIYSQVTSDSTSSALNRLATLEVRLHGFVLIGRAGEAEGQVAMLQLSGGVEPPNPLLPTAPDSGGARATITAAASHPHRRPNHRTRNSREAGLKRLIAEA